MKKRCLILIVSAICSMHIVVNAQLYVDQYGNTTVGDESANYGLFNVYSNDQPSNYPLVYFSSNTTDCVLDVETHAPSESPANSYNTTTGIYLGIESGSNRYHYGLNTWVYRESPLNSGRSYGILTYAGRSTDGWNYGICTSLQGENNGAGLFASSGNYPNGVNVCGRWAGFFDGNVNVVGSFTATDYNTPSDFRLKENIRQIDDGNLEKVMGINVVRYKIKNIEVDLGDTAKTPHYAYPEDSPILKTDHYGVLAQELQTIYPELVKEGPNGYLSVNYMELVPILIKSIQELNQKVRELEDGSSKAIQRGIGTTGMETVGSLARLYQNTPNPFSENTTIRCVIPDGVQNAMLYIYDMNGILTYSTEIKNRGDVYVTIESKDFKEGINHYCLIIDGNTVDSKRMLLIK